ncbi:myeloid:lymphoid or mixed lineage leukemia [Echinococcus multilocularis]|uniref:Myeloid:lymphoid or mixed lineage leukemia n=1 Tax=Echinococcus multilocularis TaxID=6211 RepID=A0A068YNS4_ECHMU|nr:myeloid:lymphoid or mixed lineage leukemia [Echinococcus multilocularis]
MLDFSEKIDEWNRNALELFQISELNENQEFFGVVRFYFYGPYDKYYSKCVRISSHATARHLVNVLVEKFHPDLRLLKSGRYALYEYHPSTGERRLGAEERPLMNQINWKTNQREGRFILRDESKLDMRVNRNPPNVGDSSGSINMAKWRSAGNLITETSSVEAYARSQEPIASSSDELVFAVANEGEKNTASGSTKKKSKSLKTNGNIKKRQKMAAALASNQAVIRTSSLPNVFDEPEALMNANHEGIDPQTGALTVFLQSANLPTRSQTLKSTVLETSDQIIQRILASYGRLQNLGSYCLEQVNIPTKSENLPYSVPPRRILRTEERPLHILWSIQAKFPRVRTEFHLVLHQDESLSLHEDASSRQQDYANISVRRPAPQLVEVNPNGTAKVGKVLRFNLTGLVQQGGGRQKAGVPIKVGSQFASVGPPPNIVLSANRFPDIRPVHCTLLPASSAVDGEKGESTSAAVLISPALDITTRPPGPTAVCLDGRKVVRPTPLRHGCIVQLGRSLFLKFLEQGTSLEKTRQVHEQVPKGSMPDLTFQESHRGWSPEKHYRSRTSLNQPAYTNTDQLFPDRLPILVDVCLPSSATSTTTDDFAACLHEAACDSVDAVLKLATSLSFHTTSVTSASSRSTSRPPIFVLTPAFLLYGLLRGCLRRWKVAHLTREQHEHYLSGLLNHIGSQMFQCIQTCCQGDFSTWLSMRVIFNQLLFWMANSSELLNFLQNDTDFSEAIATSSHLLANCIDSAFHELCRGFLELLKYLTPSLLFPGDFDQQDDLRLDDRPLPPTDDIYLSLPSTNLEPNIQRLLQILAFMMRGMRQACVNVSFALQLFAYVFHSMGAWIFNSIVQAKDHQEGRKGSVGSLWTTRLGAGRLMRRLQRVNQWATRHGLGSVCEVHLLIPVQTCQLITADRSKFRPFQKRVLELRSLNSARVEWLLTHLGDPPPLTSEWIKNITKSVRQEIDREIMEQHGSPSSRETRELLSLQVPVELPLPLIVPPEGYVATSGLVGIPEGFMETVQPLVEDGCLSVRRNELAFKAPLNGMWTGHFRNRSDSRLAPSGHPTNKTINNQPDANVEHLAKEAGVKLSTVKRLVLQKNGQPLGLGIVAAKPEGNAPYGIYIRHIVPSSVAAQDGRVEVGDQILAIANSSLVNCDQSEAAVSILARISTAVHLVVAKRAAQARGIMNLINSAQRGRPIPTTMARSTPSLNQASHWNQEEDDDEDEDDDDDDGDGVQFGSRVPLGKGASQRQSQQSLHRPKSVDGLTNGRGVTQAPKIREFEVSSDDISSDEGSDEVWNSTEKTLKPTSKYGGRPSPPEVNLSFQPSPASVQGSLDSYKFRSQQDLRSSGLTTRPSSNGVDNESSSTDLNDFAKRNAEATNSQKNGPSKQDVSPSLSSLSSTSSIITQEIRKDPPNVTKPSQEGVYTNASEMTSESEDIITNVKQRIPSETRAATAEKTTSPLNASPARSVTDKAMQTVAESNDTRNVSESKKPPTTVSLQASAVQTEPVRMVQEEEDVVRYTPPLDRLPLVRVQETRNAAARPNPPLNGPTLVEDVTKAVIDPQVGRFHYQPLPPSRPLPKQKIVTTSASYSDLRPPYSTTNVNTRAINSRPEPSTIQSGVTYWSSQTDLAVSGGSPPPEPTANFPQYHPPDSLEPSDLAIKYGDVGPPRGHRSPSLSPTGPSMSVYGPPASHFIPQRSSSRGNSPMRLDLIQRSRSLSASNHTVRAGSLNRVTQSETVDNGSRHLQDLARGIRQLEDAVEANPNADLIRELDQLRVEYRFQLQMNERSRTRSLNAPYMHSPGVGAPPKAGPPVMPKPRPFVPNMPATNGSAASQPFDDLANERLEALRAQEQRARIYEENLSRKHNSNLKSSTSGNLHFAPPATPVPPLQPKYTYQVESGPLYEEDTGAMPKVSVTSHYSRTATLQSPLASSPNADVRYSPLTRGTELRASRKSVTFDTNLESVALYSPPETPSGLAGKTYQPTNQVRQAPMRVESQSASRFNRSTASEPRSPTYGSSVTQPENAENLSFKDKMAFFAKTIGEDMPKDRYKASLKERQIANNLLR